MTTMRYPPAQELDRTIRQALRVSKQELTISDTFFLLTAAFYGTSCLVN